MYAPHPIVVDNTIYVIFLASIHANKRWWFTIASKVVSNFAWNSISQQYQHIRICKSMFFCNHNCRVLLHVIFASYIDISINCYNNAGTVWSCIYCFTYTMLGLWYDISAVWHFWIVGGCSVFFILMSLFQRIQYDNELSSTREFHMYSTWVMCDFNLMMHTHGFPKRHRNETPDICCGDMLFDIVRRRSHTKIL